MKLSREQIIKAWEKCNSGSSIDICRQCPYINENFCIHKLNTAVRSVIKCLTVEAENYRNELSEVRTSLAKKNNDIKKLTEENKNLHATYRQIILNIQAGYTELTRKLTRNLHNVEADTVRKVFTDIEELLRARYKIEDKLAGTCGSKEERCKHLYGRSLSETLLIDLQTIERKYTDE